MARLIPAFLLTPLLVLACDDLGSPKVTRVWTDAAEYMLTTTSAGYTGHIVLSFSNANSYPVTIYTCSELWRGWLERQRPTDGVWVAALGFGDRLKCGGGISIPAGATRRNVIEVADCSFMSNCPFDSKFAVSPIAGEYRIVMEVDAPPPSQIRSNTFTLLTSSP
jgi:hypothetical protein